MAPNQSFFDELFLGELGLITVFTTHGCIPDDKGVLAQLELRPANHAWQLASGFRTCRNADATAPDGSANP